MRVYPNVHVASWFYVASYLWVAHCHLGQHPLLAPPIFWHPIIPCGVGVHGAVACDLGVYHYIVWVADTTRTRQLREREGYKVNDKATSELQKLIAATSEDLYNMDCFLFLTICLKPINCVHMFTQVLKGSLLGTGTKLQRLVTLCSLVSLALWPTRVRVSGLLNPPERVCIEAYSPCSYSTWKKLYINEVFVKESHIL